MDIHEYQAKAILADFGMPIARGGIAYSPEQAAYRAKELGGEKWVVKAQIHSGARGKAGGIKICATENEVMEAANELLGRRLVTNQTGPQGKLVGRLYIEEATDIAREIYLAFVLDRSSERVVVLHRHLAVWRSRRFARPIPMPLSGCRRAGGRPAVVPGARACVCAQHQASPELRSTIMNALSRVPRQRCTMLEINPLVVTTDDRILALDAKMSFDDNALFRRPQMSECTTPRSRIRARPRPPSTISTISVSTETLAAS